MVKKLLILLSVFCLISVGCWSEETTIFRSFADFEGRKIGTVTGSAYFASVEQVINDPKAYYYDDPSGAILALKKGDIDAYATDTLSVNVLVKEVEGLAAYPEPISGDLFVAYMMRKGDSLVDEINKALAEVKAEGTYEKLYQKWMTGLDGQLIDYSQYNLNDRGNGVLKVVASPMDYPFNFVGGEGAQLQGFEIELLYCIADKLNKGLDITNVLFTAALAFMSEGKVDMGVCSTVITKERLETMDFSDPFYECKSVLLCRAENIEGAANGPLKTNLLDKIASSFEKTFIRENRWSMLLTGLGVTLIISLGAVVFGTILGFILCMIFKSEIRILVTIFEKLCVIITKIPSLVVLLIIYFVVFSSLNLSPVIVSIFAFGLLFGISFAHILTNGINNLDKGQAEAGMTLGLNTVGIYRHIILPQAIRKVLPLYKGEIVSIIKATAIVGYIAIEDLTRAGDLIRSRTYEAFFPLIAVAIIYYFLITLIVFLVNLIEKIFLNREKKRTLPKGVKAIVLQPRKAEEQVPTNGEELIRVEHLKKVYHTSPILKDVNTTIKRGDVIAVIGPSGTGKSTFLRCINHLEKATEGDIFVFGDNICAKGANLSAIRSRMGMVFQSFNLFGHLTVLENAMLAPMLVKKMSKQQAYETAVTLLHSVGMAEKMHRFPDELSGGQKQRAAIARTLAMEPEVILLDEPTSALDPLTVGEVQSVIKRLSQKGYTMLIVTHEMKFAQDVSNRVFFMDQGLIYEDGTPQQIFESPKKSRTRAFVNRLKTLNFTISDRGFDCIGMMQQIRQFGTEHDITRSRIHYMEHCFEELCEISIVPKLESSETLSVNVEFAQKTGVVTMNFKWGGKGFNPMLIGDELSIKMVRNMSSDFEYAYEGGQNTLKLIVK